MLMMDEVTIVYVNLEKARENSMAWHGRRRTHTHCRLESVRLYVTYHHESLNSARVSTICFVNG